LETDVKRKQKRKQQKEQKRQEKKRKREIQEEDLQGFKYLKAVLPLLEKLHSAQTDRDPQGNRILFYDQYAALLLLYYFSPVVTSLRGLQQASELKKVQRILGCARSSLGSLSEASQVFDPELLKEIIAELASKVEPFSKGKDLEALKGLTAVDGSLLPALPRMGWALWVDDEHRAAKMHLVFEVLRGVPENVSITEGNASETKALREMLESGRLYVMDRGYTDYSLFEMILDADSSFICRIRDGLKWNVISERPLNKEAKAAGVIRDVVLRFGCEERGTLIETPLRVIEVQTGKKDSQGKPEILKLATDRMDLDADLVALGYKNRWSVELYFRWFKCLLGCRHILSESQNGLEIQVYVGIIASLLINLWLGRKPTKRTLEMLHFFFIGWADEEELQQAIERSKKHDD
jgi:hypothetical protein